MYSFGLAHLFNSGQTPLTPPLVWLAATLAQDADDDFHEPGEAPLLWATRKLQPFLLTETEVKNDLRARHYNKRASFSANMALRGQGDARELHLPTNLG